MKASPLFNFPEKIAIGMNGQTFFLDPVYQYSGLPLPP
jgi:hypothetical protein